MDQKPSVLKAKIRKEKIAMRKSMDPHVRRKNSEKICKKIIESEFYDRAELIMMYKAMVGEVMLDDLEKDALSKNKRICYPRCIDRDHMEAFIPADENAFTSGAFGIKEPDISNSEKINPEDIDLVIVPCAAFDETCNRVGMGAGYYDRYLKKCNNAYTAAVAYEAQKVEHVPINMYDKGLNAVVSEENVYYDIRVKRSKTT